MKATLRRSGSHMVTVRIAHHLDSVLVAEALAYDLYQRTDADDMPVMTRAAAERHIREALARYGAEGLTDHLRDEIGECGADEGTQRRARRAVDTIRRFWSELDDTSLAQFEQTDIDTGPAGLDHTALPDAVLPAQPLDNPAVRSLKQRHVADLNQRPGKSKRAGRPVLSSRAQRAGNHNPSHTRPARVVSTTY